MLSLTWCCSKQWLTFWGSEHGAYHAFILPAIIIESEFGEFAFLGTLFDTLFDDPSPPPHASAQIMLSIIIIMIITII